ncbi:MAG: hypothetical protein AMDU3_IPLC00004G0428 [Thermoplasmatales archaeon I-plasma]|nr:MAG: hypothetical protein AMDU3_IPLC00004G0428 [Thermoplasmatales archaeon I-plasma]
MKTPIPPSTKQEEFFVKLLKEQDKPQFFNDADLKKINDKVVSKFGDGINVVRRRELKYFLIGEMIEELNKKVAENGDEKEKAIQMPKVTIKNQESQLKERDEEIEKQDEEIKRLRKESEESKSDLEKLKSDCKKDLEERENAIKKCCEDLKLCIEQRDRCIENADRSDKEYQNQLDDLQNQKRGMEQSKNKEIGTWTRKYKVIRSLLLGISVGSGGIFISGLLIFYFLHLGFPIGNPNFRKMFTFIAIQTASVVVLMYKTYPFHVSDSHDPWNSLKLFLVYLIAFEFLYYVVAAIIASWGLIPLRWDYWTELALFWNLMLLPGPVLPLIWTR